MSAARHRRSEDQFRCAICLDVFTEPVSTPCGHNFCKDCITRHWDMNVPSQCPMCKEVFCSRPRLQVNRLISEMVAQFRQEADEGAEADVQQLIQRRRLKIEQIQHSVEISKDAAEREGAEGLQVFTALKESVDKGLNELLTEIEDKQSSTKKQAEDVISELVVEICELELSSLSEDHLHLLQRLPSLTAAPPNKDWTEVRVRPPSYEGTVLRALSQLEEALGREMKKLSKAELKRVQQFAVDVTLDPDTANPRLNLSADGKQVEYGGMRRNLPENPESFSDSHSVLGKQSFSSGRFYFEVQVKGNSEWTLGVARESAKRKGIITLRPQEGYWTVWLKKVSRSLLGPAGRFSLRPEPEKVGVFVDYDQGLVSFHDVDTAALIFSFTHCSFKEKLHPFFSPCDSGSSPLIICPVSQTA